MVCCSSLEIRLLGPSTSWLCFFFFFFPPFDNSLALVLLHSFSAGVNLVRPQANRLDGRRGAVP